MFPLCTKYTCCRTTKFSWKACCMYNRYSKIPVIIMGRGGVFNFSFEGRGERGWGILGGVHFAISCYGCWTIVPYFAMAVFTFPNRSFFVFLVEGGGRDGAVSIFLCIRLLVLLLSARGAGYGSFIKAARCLWNSNLNHLKKDNHQVTDISLKICKIISNTSWDGSSRMERTTGAGISAGSSGMITAWTSGDTAAADS